MEQVNENKQEVNELQNDVREIMCTQPQPHIPLHEASEYCISKVFCYKDEILNLKPDQDPPVPSCDMTQEEHDQDQGKEESL